MAKSIERDHKLFRDTVAGKKNKALKKYIKNDAIYPMRGKNGRFRITIPNIESPRFVYGDNDSGIGRGPGEKGDVIDKGKKGKKGQAGNEEGEGMLIDIDLNEVIDMWAEDLELPDIKPKISPTHTDIEIKYNDIAKVGPESLRHNRRTMKEAMKRLCASGQANQFHTIPGCKDPVRLITPINSDRRYRQWKEIVKPNSTAVIMFGRDGSASMDEEKCEIISDMAWWIEAWISRFYEKTETCYFWHDIDAQEVDKEKFYKYRYGGGTKCSSCLKLMSKQFKDRFPPNEYNIYCFYFTDGDNWSEDNKDFINSLSQDFNHKDVNLFALTQILCSNYEGSIKNIVDNAIDTKECPNISTFSIGNEKNIDYSSGSWNKQVLTDDQRNKFIKDAIKKHLGKKQFANAGRGI